MRKHMRQLLASLLVLVLVLTVAPVGNAAETAAPLELVVEGNPAYGCEVIFTVNATEADVIADGKLTFQYDSEMLQFLAVEAGEAWEEDKGMSLKFNDREGSLVVAFAAGEPAQAGTAFVLTFKALAVGEAVLKVDGENSYISDVEADLTCEAVANIQDFSIDYIDVDEDDWFYEAVCFVTAEGLMEGVGNKMFAPNGTINRAMMVTILYRMAGEPAVEGTTSFKDVPADQWYTDAVVWAVQEKITKGLSAEAFGPMLELTREQMVAFFGRYAEYQGVELESDGTLEGFKDANKVSAYAVPYMVWAVEVGLINGMNATTLNPRGNSTRAQTATVVMRYCGLAQ